MIRLAAPLLAGAAIALAALPAAAQTGVAAPAAVAPADARPGAYVLDPAHGKITWSVSHLGFSTYVGQFRDVQAKLNLDPKNPSASTLEATIPIDRIGTLHDGLDKHLKAADFLDVAKFPTATFKSTKIVRTGERTADITGDLTLHGVTKPVVVQATFNKAGPGPGGSKYRVGFDGKAAIKMTDFDIAPKFAPMLGEVVTLAIEGEFTAAE